MMMSLPLGLAMSGKPERLVNLRPWSRNRCRISPRSALVMFCILVRSGGELISAPRLVQCRRGYRYSPVSRIDRSASIQSGEQSFGNPALPSPVPGLYASPFSQGRREPPAEFSPVLDNGRETLEIDAVHAFRGFPLLRQDMDHRDLRERRRELYPLDAAVYAVRSVIDAFFELRGQRHQVESGDGLQKVEVFSSRPRVSGILRHMTCLLAAPCGKGAVFGQPQDAMRRPAVGPAGRSAVCGPCAARNGALRPGGRLLHPTNHAKTGTCPRPGAARTRTVTAPTPLARAQPGRERLGVHTRQLPLEPCLPNL